MAIYFNTIPTNEPFIFESIGNHWNQDRVIRPKGYPLYHYLQTEKGCGQIEIQGKTYFLNEGEGVLIAPSISHSYFGKSDNWSTLFVTVAGRIESSIASMLGNRQIIFVEKEQGEKLAHFITKIIGKYESPPLNAKALSVDCYEFLMQFVDGIYDEEMVNEPLYSRYIKPIVTEIETNYGDKLTVDGLSRMVYITPQYLSRLFRRFLGCSVYEYLTAYRITKAKELLFGSPRLEVQNIAGLVGFDDASHFSAMFKKITGVTPLEFRMMHKFRE